MNKIASSGASGGLSETGYIVCRACGARIRADRGSCLRCGELLEAAPETVSLSAIYRGRPLIITLAVAAAAAVLIALLWIGRPRRKEEAARPAGGSRPAVPARAIAAAAPAAPSSDAAGAAAWSMETLRADSGSPAADVSQSELQQAETDLERSIDQNPRDASALNSLGEVLARLGDRSGAISRFERAVELSPGDAKYHANLARAFAGVGQWSPAASEFRRGVRLDPSDLAMQFNLALSLHKAANDLGAIAEYRAALVLAPDDAASHLGLANSLERAGQVNEAREEYQRYLEIAPDAENAEAVRDHRDTLEAGSAPGLPAVSPGSSR